MAAFIFAKFDSGPDDQKFLDREEKFVGPKPWPKTGEVADWISVYGFTSDTLVPQLIAGPDVVDLAGYTFALPVIVIQGRDDYICPTAVSRQYVANVHAPAKAFTKIDGGHFACLTNPTDFRAALRRLVVPHIK